MKYPVTISLGTVQMREDDDIWVTVSVRSAGENVKALTMDFRMKPLDTPVELEDYVRMAVAAACDAL